MDNQRHAIYARVSTTEQDSGLDSQLAALREYCNNHRIESWEEYTDIISGAKSKRPGLDRLKADIFAGKVNTVICWKLDRLSRSMLDGVTLLYQWLEKGVRIISISQQLDFNGAMGRFIASIMFALAEMERAHIRENVKRGMDRARAQGKKIGGGHAGYMYKVTPDKLAAIAKLYKSGTTIKEICPIVGLSRQWVTKILQGQGIWKPKRPGKIMSHMT